MVRPKKTFYLSWFLQIFFFFKEECSWITFSLLHTTPIYQVLSDLKYSSNPVTYLSSSFYAVDLATIIVAWTTEVISNSFPYFYSCLPQFIFDLAATWIIKKERMRKKINIM